MCGELPRLWVTLFKTHGRQSRVRLEQKKGTPGCCGIREFLKERAAAAAGYRQRVVIRNPTMATPKPTRMFPAPSAGTG